MTGFGWAHGYMMDDRIHAGHELHWLRLSGFFVHTIDRLYVLRPYYIPPLLFSCTLIMLSSLNPSSARIGSDRMLIITLRQSTCYKAS
jgi:hypothetical protein